MILRSEDMNNAVAVLEHQARTESETARQAIREYNETLLTVENGNRARLIEKQRMVERAVCRYIQIQKELDRLRAQMSSSMKA